MNEKEIRAAVFGALSSVAPEVEAESIDPTAELQQELDIDSLDFLNFVIALRNETGIEIPEGDYPQIVTLDGCVAYLTKATATATGPS
jgi:acyl carrier protein